MIVLKGALVFVFCVVFRPGSCGEGPGDESGESSESQDDTEASKQRNVETSGEMVDTVKWPFSENGYQPNEIQSPIKFKTSLAKQKSLPQLVIYEPQNRDVEAVCKNTGTTVQVYIEEEGVQHKPFLEGGPLNHRFYFEQMHFHWGNRDNKGSEHVVDDHYYSAEIHLVHYNGKYSNFQEAMKKGDGLAVLTVFAEEEEGDNALLDPLKDVIKQIINPEMTYKLHWEKAMKWVLKAIEDNKNYYTYPGSLTTPPYSQNVAFIVLTKPVGISSVQIAEFRSLHDARFHEIKANRRSTQPFNDRPIFKGSMKIIPTGSWNGIAIKNLKKCIPFGNLDGLLQFITSKLFTWK
ncbi:carbonic anhydrase 13-like [Macrosteles quadrilineatus]|uniref:carbonic anhydrase 13-like n=1 Tax=Macrosteles quadrilineatus TaxID=74068 RepID=UPI0023E25247|nr:carbonic anhydrase 13-like [Macrosteles quadrilineatus]XP_054268736.1 carbonic anhydrase 13-like [Macrosteles quadrilineatus]